MQTAKKDDQTARLPADLVTMARMISVESGETVGEIFDAAARATIERRYRKSLDRLNRDLPGGESGGA